MPKKKQGNSQKQQYASYKNEGRYEKNAKRKLEAYCRKNPNDKQAQKRLAEGKFPFRRKKPHSKVWRAGARMYAQLLTTVGSKGNLALHDKKAVVQ